MDSWYSLIDIFIFGCGVYLLYCYYLLKVKGEIKEGVLLPKGTSVKKCKDKEGFIQCMAPKLLIYGIAVVLCGALGMLESQMRFMGNWYLAIMAVFLAVTAWFAVAEKKALKKYWQ